jgi:integrase/recombinase XerD
MSLTLRKRHTTGCREKNGISEWKDFRRCTCPFWAIGTVRREGFVRVSTKEHKIDLAELTKRKWEEAGTVEVVIEKPTELEAVKATTLVEAWEQFGEHYVEAKKLKPPTRRKYKLLEKVLGAFADDHGYRYVKEFGLAELQDFQASWKIGPATHCKRLEHLHTFSDFCVESGYITVNHSRKLHAPDQTTTKKEPFLDEEMDRILVVARQYPTRRGDYVGPRAYALTLLLRYSGLRISDALSVTPQRLDGRRLFLYQRKTDGPVYVKLPAFVVDALNSLELVNGRYFWTGRGTEELENVRKSWTKLFGRIFKHAGPFTSKPHIHRFRHTFACDLLQKNVRVEHVAMLLGHSDPKVTARHYARWVKGRQDLLDEIMDSVYDSDPRTFQVLPGGKKSQEEEVPASRSTKRA